MRQTKSQSRLATLTAHSLCHLQGHRDGGGEGQHGISFKIYRHRQGHGEGGGVFWEHHSLSLLCCAAYTAAVALVTLAIHDTRHRNTLMSRAQKNKSWLLAKKI